MDRPLPPSSPAEPAAVSASQSFLDNYSGPTPDELEEASRAAFAAAGVVDAELVQLAMHHGIEPRALPPALESRAELDMFMGQHRSMRALGCFRALRVVTVSHEPAVATIEGVADASAPSLRELWVTHCALSSSSGVAALATGQDSSSLSREAVEAVKQAAAKVGA